MIAAVAEYGDIILCQITSKSYSSKTAIIIEHTDFTHGGLKAASYVRSDKLFTVARVSVREPVGRLRKDKTSRIRAQVVAVFR